MCWSFFLIKLEAFRPATLLKKRLEHMCFPMNIVWFLKMPILKSTHHSSNKNLNKV